MRLRLSTPLCGKTENSSFLFERIGPNARFDYLFVQKSFHRCSVGPMHAASSVDSDLWKNWELLFLVWEDSSFRLSFCPKKAFSVGPMLPRLSTPICGKTENSFFLFEKIVPFDYLFVQRKFHRFSVGPMHAACLSTPICGKTENSSFLFERTK